MPDIFGQPTPSEMLAIVKSNRLLSEDVKVKTGVPHDEIAGKVIMFAHIATAAEDAANRIDIRIADMNVVDAKIIQFADASGGIMGYTPTIVFDNVTGVLSIISNEFAATDICNILIKGRKV